MSTLRRFPFRPMEASPPNVTVPAFQEALRKAISEASKRETGVVRFVPGCDGRPVVTAYQGSCQDQARAVSGGQAAIAVDLGNGARVVVARDLGRGYSASSGYQGAGLASGAFPSPVAPGASDLALDPIDSVSGVTIEGEPSDIGSSLVGAVISAAPPAPRLTGYGLTLATDASTRFQLWYWNDTAPEDPPVEVSTSCPYGWESGNTVIRGLRQVEMLTETRAMAIDIGTATIHFFENGEETGTFHIEEFDLLQTVHHNVQANRFCILPGSGGDEAVIGGCFEPSRDNQTVTTGLVHISGLLTGQCVVEHVWKITDWWEYYPFGVLGQAAVAADGTVYACGEHRHITHSPDPPYYEHNYATGIRFVAKWAPPYDSPPEVIFEQETDLQSDQYRHAWYPWVHRPRGQEYCLVARSREGTYNGFAWTSWQRVPGGIIYLGSGNTPTEDVSAFFDLEDNLWIWVVDENGATSLARFGPPYAGPPASRIDLPWTIEGLAFNFHGRHTSRDGSAIFALGTNPPAPTGFTFFRAPFVEGPAMHHVPSPSPTDSIAHLSLVGVRFPQGQAGLTVSASLVGSAPSGSGLEVTTRLEYTNTGEDALDVRLTIPLPEGSSFVSASNEGTFDPETRLVTWELGTVPSGASGQVELTTTTAT